MQEHTFILNPFLPVPDIQVTGKFLMHPKYFEICYQVLGNISILNIPAYISKSERVDKLWEHTCFELFVKPTTAYFEYNFSPDNMWNVFHFDDYRDNKQEYQGITPKLTSTYDKHAFSLSVTLPILSPCHIGISCVLEHQEGTYSYWALAHGGEQPDFHKSDLFIPLTY